MALGLSRRVSLQPWVNDESFMELMLSEMSRNAESSKLSLCVIRVCCYGYIGVRGGLAVCLQIMQYVRDEK